MDSHKIVFRTNQPHEILLVQNHFRELGIRHFGQEQSVTGLREAMPQTPVPAPGLAWAMFVPSVAIEDAIAVVSDLGLESQPEEKLWSNGTAEISQGLRKIYIAIITVFVISTLAVAYKWVLNS